IAGFSTLLTIALRADALRLLRRGFGIQAAGLVLLAVPVALSGVWISVGWAAMAVAFAALAMITGLKIPRYSALLSWGLALAQLLAWTSHSPDAREIWLHA